jgi:hypothetical protein
VAERSGKNMRFRNARPVEKKYAAAILIAAAEKPPGIRDGLRRGYQVCPGKRRSLAEDKLVNIPSREQGEP